MEFPMRMFYGLLSRGLSRSFCFQEVTCSSFPWAMRGSPHHTSPEPEALVWRLLQEPPHLHPSLNLASPARSKWREGSPICMNVRFTHLTHTAEGTHIPRSAVDSGRAPRRRQLHLSPYRSTEPLSSPLLRQEAAARPEARNSGFLGGKSFWLPA